MSAGHDDTSWAQEFYEDWLNLGKWVKWVGDWGISRGMFLVVIFVGEFIFLSHLIPSLPLYTFNWLVGTAPIWLPISLIVGFWRVWMWYVHSLFLSGRNPILLEVKMPRDVFKSPRAMEIAFSLLSISSGETTFLHRAWKGQVRPYFSFEFASFGGEIRYFIWCWKNYKSEIEAVMYGQYPEVELYEVEDYATKFQFDPEKHAVYCTDWRLETYLHDVDAGKMQVNAYPPKSYIDFELDKDPKEEFKVDPLSTVMEFIGNIEPQEEIWAQFMISKCGNEGILFQKEEDHEWMDEIESEVQKIRAVAAINPVDPTQKSGFPHPTWKQTEQIRTMQRHLGKMPFKFIGRGVYISKNKHMHGPTYTGVRWLWKPINNPHYMSQLRPRRWHNPYDYPWQDVHDYRWNLHATRFFDAYRRRSGFHTPWNTPYNIVTNETLATIWRPPSRTVTVPGLQRIPATKAAPPANLPK